VKPTRFGYISVPNLQPNVQVTGFVRADVDVPMRVVVRNTGPTVLRLGTDSAALAQATTDCYFLPVGASDIFVIAPGQTIYVVSAGPGGQLSFAASEAIPNDSR
jgi:hypothetical protein